MGEKDEEKGIFLNSYLLQTKSPVFQKTIDFCQKVANSDANVLLAGESGTGKEILSRLIHCSSNRNDKEFIAVNCSSYAASLLESELFGHEQGAFTGATTSKKGKFELAEGGTLLLDEVGDISLQTQIKLLRVLETKSVERLGSNVQRKINFRLISATNVDLQSAVEQSVFREDFFYRVSTIVIHIPPLRERLEDLDDLITFFLKKFSKENGMEIREVCPSAIKFLHTYHYPGNVRELKNIIDRMVVLSENGVITEDGVPVMHSFYRGGLHPAAAQDYQKIVPFRNFKQESERTYLTWVLSQTGGNVAEAARQLDMSTRQLFNKIKDLDIAK